MPSLKNIAETVQQVAEAISHAVGIETEIVDNKLTIIGGTGFYKDKLGEKEELGQLEANYLYGRVLRLGKTQVVKDARQDLTYDQTSVIGETKELAEICTPIKVDDEIIGIIGLVAFEKEQQKRLLKEQHDMVLFVERMAELLAAKASQTKFLHQVQKAKNEIITILETIHEGMLAIDSKGYITYCNSIAEVLLKTTRSNMMGKHLSRFMSNTQALRVLETGQGYTEKEEICKQGSKDFHFIVTAKPIKGKTKVNGAVISFRDIIEARKLVYNMSKRTLKYTFDDIIGKSDSIVKVKNQAALVAKGNSTVLITGESGTGKELFAKAIHYASLRKNGPFVTINCGAIPESLMESELFGYEKGAFTGAKDKGKAGKFELADGGTIFLDEIGELHLHLQVKLLHVLQNKRFERVGGNKTISCNVRVVAATNRDLEAMIKEQKFRSDLYYRLSVIPIKIPPLRERIDDIILLKDYFLKKYNAYMSKNIIGFSKEIDEIFISYDWPGNVRELENAVEYAVNMTFNDKIEADAVTPRLKKLYKIPNTSDFNSTLQEQVEKFERDIFISKLSKYGSSNEAKVKIAKELDISRATLYRKLAKYKL